MVPLVSVIMPTYNRREFIPSAIRVYLSQDWPDKELIVVDDGTDRVEDLFRDVPNVKYVFYREPNLPAYRAKTPIGTKRNMACEHARGEIIVHLDDDDWSAPGRITDQVLRLMQSNKGVSGYNSMLFSDGQRAWKYANADLYSLGTALCYRKEWWGTHRFPLTSWGEDRDFTVMAREENQIVAVDAGQMMVARVHPGSSNWNSQDRGTAACWPEVSIDTVPQGFFS